MAKSARQSEHQLVHYLRKAMVFGDSGTALSVGTLPSGAVILPAISGVIVTTVFNGATSSVVDIGTLADPDLYATDLNVKAALGLVALDEAVDFSVSADTEITATLTNTGATTTGAGVVVIAYAVDNDG